jgi:hypothetical protein
LDHPDAVLTIAPTSSRGQPAVPVVRTIGCTKADAAMAVTSPGRKQAVCPSRLSLLGPNLPKGGHFFNR